MEELIKEFLTIWDTYFNMISIQPNDFKKFIMFVIKLRQKSKLEIQEKKIFIELIELVADTVYTINNCADKYESKYGTTYYQQTKNYEEPELNTCSNLINYLESELCWDLENEYDIEKSKNNCSEFWTYCGIKIPIYIKEVPSIDNVNTHYSDGSETEMFGINVKSYTLKEYQNKYSITRSNGELFWKE